MNTTTATREQLREIAVRGATMSGAYARGDVNDTDQVDRMIDHVLAGDDS